MAAISNLSRFYALSQELRGVQYFGEDFKVVDSCARRAMESLRRSGSAEDLSELSSLSVVAASAATIDPERGDQKSDHRFRKSYLELAHNLHMAFSETIRRLELECVSDDIDLNGRESEFKDLYSPLCIAASCGSLRALRTLVAAGAHRNDPFSTENALMHAVRGGHTECVEYLLAAGAPTTKAYRTSLLSEAAKMGDLPTMKVLMQAGDCDPTVFGVEWAPLECAKDAGQKAVVDYLLSEPRHPCIDQARLMSAVVRGDLEAARGLLEAGVDPNFILEKGEVSLIRIAIRSSGDNIVQLFHLIKLLFAHGARVDDCNQEELHYLGYSMQALSQKEMSELIEACPDPQQGMWLAIQSGWPTAVTLSSIKLLARKGADFNLPHRKSGEFPVQVVVSRYVRDGGDADRVLGALFEAGAIDVDDRALTEVRGWGRPDIEELLLRKGSDPRRHLDQLPWLCERFSRRDVRMPEESEAFFRDLERYLRVNPTERQLTLALHAVLTRGRVNQGYVKELVTRLILAGARFHRDRALLEVIARISRTDRNFYDYLTWHLVEKKRGGLQYVAARRVARATPRPQGHLTAAWVDETFQGVPRELKVEILLCMGYFPSTLKRIGLWEYLRKRMKG